MNAALIRNKYYCTTLIKNAFYCAKAYKNESEQVSNDNVLGLEYIKLKPNDSILNKILINAKSSKQNSKNSQIIIEGKRLLTEALNSGLELKSIFFNRNEEVITIKDEIHNIKNVQLYKVSQHDLKLCSTLTTPPGLIAIFKHPKFNDNINLNIGEQQKLPFTVICDNIKEPNNLGSIIRTCAAIPCKKVIVLKGCCDPWNSKSLRGGCGAHFKINIVDNITWEDAIKSLSKTSTIFIAENNMEKLYQNQISMQDYSNISVSKDNVIIIGGETYGVSKEAYRLIKNRKGFGIHIPLANGIDSLNTASALSLILFTMRMKLNVNIY